MASLPKLVKVNYAVKAASQEGAIADLSEKFLRFDDGKIKILKQATDFPLRLFCKSLMDDWQQGKVAYQPGKLTLVFNHAQPDIEADLLIYQPAAGDRFLYTRKTPPPLGQLSLPLDMDMLQRMGQQLQTLTTTLSEVTANQRALETRMESRPPAPSPIEEVATALDLRALRDLLEAQATLIVGQVNAIAQNLQRRMDALEAQLEQITAQLDSTDEPVYPHSDAEWRQRFQETWGTVGDYEQYSTSHREANAETPLFETPDWVSLCELDWARRLHPTLALLYSLIQGDDGIGFSGADVLHQFGQHVDPRTGDRYYIYKIGGYSAFEALWQMATHPHYPWLKELQRVSQKVSRHPEIFKLFGWEGEAIAALEKVIQQAQRQAQQRAYSSQQAGQSSQGAGAQGNGQQRRASNPLSDYLAILNIGPFTPISPESLKQAYRQAMKTAHPDTGGSKERAQRVNAAYEALMRHYFPNAI